ncbi:hypothetical protein ACQ4M3_27050 [Leptolyngbya sp. AN03gr2]|uniref:hypothetical protein n=1 Tax=unclassified Leptolyngbya TaxID=2650499 RepID=UPI003D319606
MSCPTASCTGSVRVLEAQQTLNQHFSFAPSPLTKPKRNPHKLCTIVENGRVVVRPVEPSTESAQHHENAGNQ